MNETDLKKHGWCELTATDLTCLNEELVEISRELGTPVSPRRSVGLVQELIPRQSPEGYPNSLTAKYSLDEFPFHVDTAHWPTPCRYVILGCAIEGESNRKTILVDFSEFNLSAAEKDALFNAPFKVFNGRNSFYSTVLSKNREFLRYDPGCMAPATECGSEVTRIFADERINRFKKYITWTTGKIVIFDNWRIMHSRGISQNNGVDRILNRILVV